MASNPETSSTSGKSDEELAPEVVIRNTIIASMEQTKRIAEELSKKWKEPSSSVEENLERIKEKMREFFFKAANRLERCKEDEHGKIIQHLESMIKDFKDSKITSH